MVRDKIAVPAPHDGREQYGSMLRRAFPLGVGSFEGLDGHLEAIGARNNMDPEQGKILGSR